MGTKMILTSFSRSAKADIDMANPKTTAPDRRTKTSRIARFGTNLGISQNLHRLVGMGRFLR